MTIDAQLLQILRTDINAALEAVAKKHNLSKLHAGNVTYDPSGSFTFKLVGTAEGGLSKEAARYKSLRAYEPGLPELNTEFKANGGKSFVIVGSNTTGTKILATHGGKTFLFAVDDLIRLAAMPSKSAQAAK